MSELSSAVDQWFLDNVEPRPPDGKLHPSSMSGCWRQAVYEARGTEPTNAKAARNYRIMWFGSRIHEVLQQALKGLPGFASEVEVAPDGWPFAGSADGIYIREFDANADSSDDWELLEFKSIAPYMLKSKDLPQDHHKKQARMYMWGLNKQGTSVAQARIVYVSRNDMEMREFVLERDLKWEEEFEQDLDISRHLYLKEGQTMLPPRLDINAPEGWLCKYCQFQTKCWEVDDA